MRHIVIGLTLLLAAGCGGGDPHAQAACRHVREAAAVDERTDSTSLGAMVDVAKAEFAAIAEAKKAGNPGLRKAGGATDLGSGLPLDDPLYRNPADVAFNAVLDWCRANG